MRVRVIALRRSGRRFHDRNQESVPGDLLLHSIMRGSDTHRVATLKQKLLRGSHTEDALPPLYEPELVAIGNDAFLLRGFESDGGVGYVQEWRCLIERA